MIAKKGGCVLWTAPVTSPPMARAAPRPTQHQTDRTGNLPKAVELHHGLIFHFKGLSSERPFFAVASAGFNQCKVAGLSSSTEDE